MALEEQYQTRAMEKKRNARRGGGGGGGGGIMPKTFEQSFALFKVL